MVTTLEKPLSPVHFCPEVPNHCEASLVDLLAVCEERRQVCEVERKRNRRMYEIVTQLQTEPRIESPSTPWKDLLLFVLPPLCLAVGVFIGTKLH